MTPQLIGRLLAPVSVVSILLLVLAFGAAWYVRDIQRAVSVEMMNNVESVRAAQELEISIREMRSQFDRYLITLDKKYLEPVPRIRKRTDEALEAVERTATTPSEEVFVRRTRTGYNHFFAKCDEILKHPDQGLYPKIIELIDTLLINEIFDPAHEYLRLNEGMLSTRAQANRDLVKQLTTGMLIIGLFGSIGGLLAGTVIAVAIRRNLLRAEASLHNTAAQLDSAAHPGRHTNAPTPTASAVERMTISATAVLSRLRQTERDALRAEQLAWVGQMAAGIAHEIRNPLMAIKVLVQAVAERRNGPEFRPRDLQVLEEEIIRLEQIVSGFLDFARPPRLELRPVDVRELAERVLEGIRARAELQSVQLHFERSSGPTVASVDPNQVRQVIFNLLFNALDAQPMGGYIRLLVVTRTTLTNMPEIELRVEDGGPGVPPELVDQIFEPFVSSKESGLGLGLSICRRIAECHAGSLQLESTPTSGTAFVLRLPVIPPNTGLAATSAPSLEAYHGDLAHRG